MAKPRRRGLRSEGTAPQKVNKSVRISVAAAEFVQSLEHEGGFSGFVEAAAQEAMRKQRLREGLLELREELFGTEPIDRRAVDALVARLDAGDDRS